MAYLMAMVVSILQAVHSDRWRVEATEQSLRRPWIAGTPGLEGRGAVSVCQKGRMLESYVHPVSLTVPGGKPSSY